MRIGLVVDSACDLPLDYIQRNFTMLPITVKIGSAVLADQRNEQATLEFLDAQSAELIAQAETQPFTVQQVQDLFLRKLVIDYDYVFCMTITKTRSPVHDNAQQASFAILNDYKGPRSAAGITSPFSLRVIDTQSVFSGQAICAVEAVRLRDAGEGAPRMRARIEQVALATHAYMVPRDLNYLRNRTRHRGDRSVSFLSAALGSALDIKPLLHCNRGETGPLAKFKGFDTASEKLFGLAARRVREGRLLTPTVAMSYGGKLEEMHALPGYRELVDTCRQHGVDVFESMMSLTAMVNVGRGSLTLAFASEAPAYD
ncbi:DegV family protein [Lysobacter sp. N42]|uniref:DegV family protein n=1 Tax=Lysobacter sp. N42 TaxID=2545719 RepID=UPI001043326D|nr:DegV family protein [Lysobacter sp. N42]TCZ87765.1 DegV family EDD domain-containing protein [Lysobacter sp. N42]